jgi:hypothetical protein
LRRGPGFRCAPSRLRQTPRRNTCPVSPAWEQVRTLRVHCSDRTRSARPALPSRSMGEKPVAGRLALNITALNRKACPRNVTAPCHHRARALPNPRRHKKRHRCRLHPVLRCALTKSVEILGCSLRRQMTEPRLATSPNAPNAIPWLNLIASSPCRRILSWKLRTALIPRSPSTQPAEFFTTGRRLLL